MSFLLILYCTISVSDCTLGHNIGIVSEVKKVVSGHLIAEANLKRMIVPSTVLSIFIYCFFNNLENCEKHFYFILKTKIQCLPFCLKNGLIHLTPPIPALERRVRGKQAFCYLRDVPSECKWVYPCFNLDATHFLTSPQYRHIIVMKGRIQVASWE